MASTKLSAVFDSMENRQLFAFAGGFSPTPFTQIESNFAIIVAFNPIAMPSLTSSWMFGNHFHQPRQQPHDVITPSDPSSDSTDHSGSTETSNPSNDLSSQSTTTLSVTANDQPAQADQTQSLALVSPESSVNEVESVLNAKKINITSSNSTTGPKYVAVKVLTGNVFNNTNLIDNVAGKATENLAPQLLNTLASSVMSTQKMIASTLLSEIKSGSARPSQADQSEDTSENLDESQIVQSNTDDHTTVELAMIQPTVEWNKNFLIRMAIGISAFLVISYWWTRRFASQTRSIVLKTGNDSTSFDR